MCVDAHPGGELSTMVGLVLEDGMLLVCLEIQYKSDRILPRGEISVDQERIVVVHSESEIVTMFFSSYGELRNTGNS